MSKVNEALDKLDLVSLKLDGYIVLGPLHGGMDNENYLIQAHDQKYILYLPTQGCNDLVNRKAEHINLQVISDLGISNASVYHDDESGIKINTYLEGLSLDKSQGRPYQKISDVLKKLHQSQIKLYSDYNPFLRLDDYEKQVRSKGVAIQKSYEGLRNTLKTYREYLESQAKVPAHNDAQPSNFVENENGVYLIDFEFAANNDWVYDVACFGNITFQDALNLLKVYDTTNNKDYLKRLYLWRIFQCLQWYNVALLKFGEGLNATSGFDFKKVAQDYLQLGLTLAQDFAAKFKE